MRRRSFRFAPPSGEPSRALAWVLRAAFSRHPLAPPPAAVERIVRLAEAFELDRRILACRGEEIVARVLGRDVARRWVASRRDVIARTLVAERLAESLASAARASAQPTILLKGAALLLGGITPPGVRRLADVDALVAKAGEARLRLELLRRGFVVEGLGEPHHAPPLLHRELGIVELHTRLPGVSMADGSPLDVEGLSRADLLRPAAQLRPELGGLLLPQPAFLATNVVIHALHQHGDSPAGYPAQRWIGDLLDLEAAPGTAPRAGTAEPGLESLFRSAREAFRLELSSRELDAVVAVCTALRQGTVPPPRSDAGRLLRHSLATALDEHYPGALRIRRLARSLLYDRARLRHRLRQRAAVSGRGTRRGSTVVGFAREVARDVRSWTLVRLRRRARSLS